MAKKRSKKDQERIQRQSRLLNKFESRIAIPSDLACTRDTWEEQRHYVHTDVMLLDEEDAVGTNYILRNQQANMALLTPVDPGPIIQPREQLTVRPQGIDPIQSAMDPNAQLQRLVGYSPAAQQHAKTHQILLKYQQKQCKLDAKINGMVQDAQTVPIAWLKVNWQEDYERDGLGYGRHNDKLDSLKKFERLRIGFENDEFDDSCPEYEEMKDLEELIRPDVIAKLSLEADELGEVQMGSDGMPVLDPFSNEPMIVGNEKQQARLEAIGGDEPGDITLDDLPELSHYQGFVARQVDPEDVRFDWNITKPEDFHFAKWTAFRAWMTEAALREKYPDYDFDETFNRIRSSTNGRHSESMSAGDSDAEYGGKDSEELTRFHQGTDEDPVMRGDTYAVWEYRDKSTGFTYVWVQGASTYLAKFVEDATGSRFFDLFPLVLNRVTGKFWGPSDTELQMPLQDEVNRLRTWRNEAQKHAHPRWMISRGLLSPGEKLAFAEGNPFSLTETAIAAEDISKSIFPVIPPTYNAALYDTGPALLGLQQMSGTALASIGAGAGSGLATDSAIASEHQKKQTAFRAQLILDLYEEVFGYMAEINAQLMPEENVIDIVGTGAYWPPVDREQLFAGLSVEVEATLDDEGERQNRMQFWMNFATIAGNLGLPVDTVFIMRKLLDLGGMRTNLSEAISIPALLQSLGMVQPGGSAAGGDPGQAGGQAARPEDQGAAGAQGGNPGGGLDSAPAPQSVPNSPAA